MAPSNPSIPILVLISLLHLIAFALSIAAERRRSMGKVKPDEYDESTFCQYDSDISTVYGLVAFLLLLLSQALLNAVTKCLCCGRGLTAGASRTRGVFFFIFNWVMFVGAEACLLAGAARNAYHTKYRGILSAHDISCATLRKGVFGAAAVLVLLTMFGSLLSYVTYPQPSNRGWQKYQSDQGAADVGMSSYHKTESGIEKN